MARSASFLTSNVALSDFTGHHHIMSGELLADLPAEVRVHIFSLALGLTTAGALLRRWLNLALVGQGPHESSSLRSVV